MLKRTGQLRYELEHVGQEVAVWDPKLVHDGQNVGQVLANVLPQVGRQDGELLAEKLPQVVLCTAHHVEQHRHHLRVVHFTPR